ncbi:hypothetical protein C7451_12333 [Blastomonas natatoria]|uniref:Uncharacterized protein n=1 Tax=Blastomonas natatoria TaxID=34015 RepID=A0A2V3UNU9_9SPHN|nr:hypothetical protein [Blastomonas natatoria]PXW67897.1 hypothetical protein C7451_12333 [Blastomonas natatoria]
MFRPGFIHAAILAASCSMSATLMKAPIEQCQSPQVAPVTRQRELPANRRDRRRGKGPQAKPAKRSNRLHISRRTRRKHRRAA